MLNKIDDDKGTIHIMFGGKSIWTFEYHPEDRKEQKMAHIFALTYIDGWNDCARTLGLNSAGVPVFQGEAA